MDARRNPPLECEITSRIVRAEDPASPTMAPGELGLWLGVADVVREDGALRCRLLVSFRFSSAFYFAFRDADQAVVFSVEDADTGRARALRAICPFSTFLDAEPPNFRGLDAAAAASGVSTAGWLAIPIRVAFAPREGHPGVFARACLREHVSNTVDLLA